MVQQAASAVAEPITEVVPREVTRSDKKRKHQPRYNVVLWDDDEHTYAYVIVMLQAVFGYPPEKGFLLAEEVDKRGKVIVLTTTLEHAELKRDQIHAYGKDDLISGCKGSMSATLEPTE